MGSVSSKAVGQTASTLYLLPLLSRRWWGFLLPGCNPRAWPLGAGRPASNCPAPTHLLRRHLAVTTVRIRNGINARRLAGPVFTRSAIAFAHTDIIEPGLVAGVRGHGDRVRSQTVMGVEFVVRRILYGAKRTDSVVPAREDRPRRAIFRANIRTGRPVIHFEQRNLVGAVAGVLDARLVDIVRNDGLLVAAGADIDKIPGMDIVGILRQADIGRRRQGHDA